MYPRPTKSCLPKKRLVVASWQLPRGPIGGDYLQTDLLKEFALVELIVQEGFFLSEPENAFLSFKQLSAFLYHYSLHTVNKGMTVMYLYYIYIYIHLRTE